MRKKIKYQGGITKYICQKKAAWHKSWFRKHIKEIDFQQHVTPQKLDIEVFSFSGASAFEDQVLSLYSFIVYAGTPSKWIIYSDKSYSQEQKDIIQKIFSFVSFKDWDTYDCFRKNKVIGDCIQASPAAKKLNIVLGHPYQGQTLYIDSDILFYKNAHFYLNSIPLKKGLWYMADNLGDDLSAFFSTDRDSIYPLNFGMLMINQGLDAADIITYLENLKGKYGYFSDQSAFDFAFKKQGAQVFDPRQFIIDISDQFDFSTKYSPDSIAMRHFVTPVRHKMWQHGWKWHFKAR